LLNKNKPVFFKLLGEFLSLQQVIGGTVVLIGIYLVNWRGSMGGKIHAAPKTN